MKRTLSAFIVTFIVISVGWSAFGAQWERIDAKTVFGTGNIEADELRRFEEVFGEQVTDVKFGNLGGSVSGSLDIAELILKRGVNITVVGACLSSCANYLFFAGNNKVIVEGGVVGFHGSPYAGTLIMPNWKSLFSVKAKASGWSNKLVRNEVKIREAIMTRERLFFEEVGINMNLLISSIDGERARRVDRCSGNSLYLFPSVAKLKQYGAKNLSGEQDWTSLFLYGELCIEGANNFETDQIHKSNFIRGVDLSSLKIKSCPDLVKDVIKYKIEAENESFVLGEVTTNTAKLLEEAKRTLEKLCESEL